MILLLDVGNSRIKWALVDADGRWHGEGALAHTDVGALDGILSAHGPMSAALGVNVAGETLGDELANIALAHGTSLSWLHASARLCGVTNLYRDPAQLGSDRWAALIGARALHPGPCIVVCAGTATTIDLLDETGVFQGGLIMPGEQLMRQALARDTARLPLAEGEPQAAPRSTAEAIVTGCLYAQAGAIERMFARIAPEADALCLLAGGNASRIAPLLSLKYQRIDNLVLRGLAVIAGSKE